jgi:hypothetical protein
LELFSLLFEGADDSVPQFNASLTTVTALYRNLETFCETKRPRDKQEDPRQLLRLARTILLSKPTMSTIIPRELYRVIVYEGFTDGTWYEDQLLIIVKALLNRRTLGLVYENSLSLSRSFLFVRCREALETVRSG